MSHILRSDDLHSYVQSVTEWLEALKKGNEHAASKIWDRYVEHLFRVAAKKLGRLRRGIGDEEDVVVIAFDNFLNRVARSGFSKLDDRDDLWQILVMLTCRHAIDLIRKEAPYLNDQLTVLDSAHDQFDDTIGLVDLVHDQHPPPEFSLAFAEELERRICFLCRRQNAADRIIENRRAFEPTNC